MIAIIDLETKTEETENGKKVIKFHDKKGNSFTEYDDNAECITIEIYNKEGNLISKETKKNPNQGRYDEEFSKAIHNAIELEKKTGIKTL